MCGRTNIAGKADAITLDLRKFPYAASARSRLGGENARPARCALGDGARRTCLAVSLSTPTGSRRRIGCRTGNQGKGPEPARGPLGLSLFSAILGTAVAGSASIHFMNYGVRSMRHNPYPNY